MGTTTVDVDEQRHIVTLPDDLEFFVALEADCGVPVSPRTIPVDDVKACPDCFPGDPIQSEAPPMDQLIVTLDGKDHYIGQGEHTVCYLPVPIGSTREEGAKQCKTCFGIVDEPAVWPVDEPQPVVEAKPAAKATKAK